MADIFLDWGGDLTLGPSGDVATVDGSTLGVQRILRRLFTNAGNGTVQCADYIWHVAYGAGLPARVGSTIEPALLSSIITSQILMESAVAKSPAPVIQVVPIANGVNVTILYWDGVTGQALTLAFDVSQ